MPDHVVCITWVKITRAETIADTIFQTNRGTDPHA